MPTTTFPDQPIQTTSLFETGMQYRAATLMRKYTELDARARLVYATKLVPDQDRMIYFVDSRGHVRHMIQAHLITTQVSPRDGVLRVMYQFLENKITAVYYQNGTVKTAKVPIPANFFGIIATVLPYRPVFHYSNAEYLRELENCLV